MALTMSSTSNNTGKAIFVRDKDGSMVTVLPGDAMPLGMKATDKDSVGLIQKAEDAAEKDRLGAEQ